MGSGYQNSEHKGHYEVGVDSALYSLLSEQAAIFTSNQEPGAKVLGCPFSFWAILVK